MMIRGGGSEWTGRCRVLTVLALTVLEQLHGLEGGAAGNDLVAELALVAALVDGITVLLGFSCAPASATTPLHVIRGEARTESEHLGVYV